MMSDCEKRYIESMSTAVPLMIREDMSEAERSLEIIRYIKDALRVQPIAYKKDIEEAYAFLDKISKEYEIDMAWEEFEK